MTDRAAIRAELDELLDLFEYTGRDEIGVLRVIARRLAMGLRQYGPLDVHDGRRWRREAAEEWVDGGVYGAAEIVRDGRETEAADPILDPQWVGEGPRLARERQERKRGAK